MKRLMSCKELSEYLSFDQTTIRNMVYYKRIPYVKEGRSLRFDKKKIDSWIEENTIEGSRLMGVNELSEYLGLSGATLRDLVNRKEIAFVRIGRTIKFDRQDIEKWIEEHKTIPT